MNKIFINTFKTKKILEKVELNKIISILLVLYEKTKNLI